MSVFPSSWKTLQLSEVAQVQTGIAKSAKRKAECMVALPYLRVANVQDGHVNLSELKTIDVPEDKVERYRVYSGDVLLTEGGDYDKLGRGCVWQGQVEKCVHQNHIFVVRPNTDRLLSDFLSVLCASRYGKTYFQSCSKQTTNLASINSTQLKEFPLLLPQLDEQEKICAFLAKWNHAIELTEKLISQKKLRRKGIMLQLLTGKRRLPGFDEKWQEVQLANLVKPVRRKNLIGVSLVLTASGEHGLVDQTTYFKRNVAGKDLSGYFLLEQGEFAYNRSSMNGYPYGAIKRLDKYESGVLSTLYICFAPFSNDFNPDFYAHVFEAGILNRQLRGIVQVGARAHGLLNVSLHDFFTIKVPLPPVKEQQAIAEVINLADRELEVLQAKAEALREQKKGLMQQLLTGKTRVKV